MASDFAKHAAGEHFMVEDLLDFSHDDDGGAFDGVTAGNSSSSVDVTPPDSCNSSFSGNYDFNFPPAADLSISGELCLPHDDLAHLEWLSNFVEESFSSDDHHKLNFTAGVPAFKTRPDVHSETHFYHSGQPVSIQSTIFNPEIPVPGKARSKRSRVGTGSWSSRLLLLSQMGRPDPSELFKGMGKKRGGRVSLVLDPISGETRKCLHCATEQTPQWRTGPMGPKTLCNACGVRYKSGRLVPEYRPASSPTFVQMEHSNSHRKVVELRKQKELLQRQQYQHHPNNMVFNSSNADDYLNHQQIRPLI